MNINIPDPLMWLMDKYGAIEGEAMKKQARDMSAYAQDVLKYLREHNRDKFEPKGK